MTRARRAVAASAAVAVAAVTSLTTAPAARGEQLGPGWEGEFVSADTYQTGTSMILPVRFTGPPGAPIVRMTLDLRLVSDDDCPPVRSFTDTVGEGDGNGETPTTPTTSPAPPTTPTTDTPSTTPPDDGNEVVHTFSVDPGCNGTYDVAVTATNDPPGPGLPGSPGTTSEELELAGVQVSLAPPSPSGLVAAADADRRVTVRWQVPASWATNPPPRDALGFQVRRLSAAGDDEVVVADGVAPNEATVVDDGLVAAPAGRYLYRVVAVRAGAGGAPVRSAPAETSVELAAPRTTTGTGTGTGGGATTPGAGGGSTGVVRTPFVPGQPAVSPAVPPEPGFDPELDYSEAELGAEEAVPPADASLFEVDEDAAGTGLLVPGAVALCLVVWAGHLRHLARRAAPPAT